MYREISVNYKYVTKHNLFAFKTYPVRKTKKKKNTQQQHTKKQTNKQTKPHLMELRTLFQWNCALVNDKSVIPK